MFRREMGVSHDHLERPVPEQLCHGAQVYSRHYESTGKSMAVAMPGIPLDLRLFERRRKPAARALQCFPAPGVSRGAPSPRIFSKAARATVFKGMVRGCPFLVFGNESGGARSSLDSSACCTARPFASRCESKAANEKEIPESGVDHRPQTGLFRIGQKSHPSRALRLAPDAHRRVAVGLLIVDAHPKDQRESRLPAIPTARSPVPFGCPLYQPSDYVILLDRVRRTRTKDWQELADA